MNPTHERIPEVVKPEQVVAWQNTSGYPIIVHLPSGGTMGLAKNEWIVARPDIEERRYSGFSGIDFRAKFRPITPVPEPAPTGPKYGAEVRRWEICDGWCVVSPQPRCDYLRNDGKSWGHGERVSHSFDTEADALAALNNAPPPPGWKEPATPSPAASPASEPVTGGLFAHNIADDIYRASRSSGGKGNSGCSWIGTGAIIDIVNKHDARRPRPKIVVEMPQPITTVNGVYCAPIDQSREAFRTACTAAGVDVEFE